MSQQLRPPIQSNTPYQYGNNPPARNQDLPATDMVTDMEIGQTDPVPSALDQLPVPKEKALPNYDTVSFQRQAISNQTGELSALLEGLEAEEGNQLGIGSDGNVCAGRNASKFDKSLYTTVHNWSSHRQSHSLSRSQTNIKQRDNPARGIDTLTHRERDYIYRTEEDNLESNPLTGFERAYGRSWSENEAAVHRLAMQRPSMSTPCPGTNVQGGTPQSYLLARLGGDNVASPITNGPMGVKRKTVRPSNDQPL